MSAGFNFNNIQASDVADITKVMENFTKIETDGITDAKATRLVSSSQDGWMSKEDKTKLDGIDSGATVTKMGRIDLNDGSIPSSLSFSGRFYAITDLVVNNTRDDEMSSAIIYCWSTGNYSAIIDLIGRHSNGGSNPNDIIKKQYVYTNNAWTVMVNKHFDDARTPKSHAVNANTYGLGTTGLYGHCKTINALTQSSHADGLALSAYQGYILNNGKQNKVTYSTTDLTAGISPLTTGEIYVVYE